MKKTLCRIYRENFKDFFFFFLFFTREKMDNFITFMIIKFLTHKFLTSNFCYLSVISWIPYPLTQIHLAKWKVGPNLHDVKIIFEAQIRMFAIPSLFHSRPSTVTYKQPRRTRDFYLFTLPFTKLSISAISSFGRFRYREQILIYTLSIFTRCKMKIIKNLLTINNVE